MIDSMLQQGTDAALDDQVTRPRTTPPSTPFSLTGLMTAPFRGIGGGVAKSLAFGAELSGAFGQVAGATGAESGGGMFSLQSETERSQSEAARQKLTKPGGGIEFSNEGGDAMRSRAADIMPDPQTAHTSEQLVAGLFDYGTRAIGYSLTLGPLGPAAMGGDAGLEEADRLKQQGVDIGTRTKAGAVAGALNAAAVGLPMSGATRLIRGAKGVAIGEGTIVGQSVAEQHILRAAGYDKLADTFDPLDPVALSLGLVPGALGAAFGHAAPAKIKPPRTEGEMKTAAAFTPAEQAHSDAYERSATNLASLERAIKEEKNPQSRALLETELAKQRTAAHEHAVDEAVRSEPDAEPAARVAQVTQALDETRLTPDADLVGRDAHLSAVQLAADQLGRGEDVQVRDLLPALDEERLHRAVDSMRGPLEPVLRADDPHLARLEPEAREVLGDRYARAARDKPAFDSALQRIAEETGSQTKLAALKGSERSVDKVLADYGGDASRMKDILRGTIQVQSIEQARQVIASLHQRFSVHEGSKRNLLDPSVQTVDGYRDAKFNVDLGGHTAEIQVNLPGMLAAKKEVHPLYVRREKLTREAMDRGDLTLPPEVTALNAKMRSVYDAAWAKTLDTSARKADSSIGLPLRRAEEGSNGRGEGGSQQTQSEGGTPAPSDTGIPSTSKNSAPSGNLAGRDADVMLTSKQSVTESSVARAAEDVAKLDPTMMVQLEGMDAPMPVGELLAKVKEEAAQDVRNGKLVEVAAACDLSS